MNGPGDQILAGAGLSYRYERYPAPQPMEVLWRRRDLGCVLMCGYPIALGLAEVTPIAAPVPSLAWASDRPLYRSDLIVRADSATAGTASRPTRRSAWASSLASRPV